MSQQNIALIIPALNEEAALARLLAELPRSFARWVIVVDNGSTDSTAQVAREAGVMVVSQPVRGYGRACWTGFRAAQMLGAEILVFMDGDGSDNPADLPMMLQTFLTSQAQLVLGSRTSSRAEPGAVPLQARLGNWLVSRLVHLLYRVTLQDIGSFRIIACSTLHTLQMREMTFGWPVEMVVKAARMGYRVIEVPIHYRRRSHGRSKVAGTLTGSISTAYFMLRTTFRYAGMRRLHA